MTTVFKCEVGPKVTVVNGNVVRDPRLASEGNLGVYVCALPPPLLCNNRTEVSYTKTNDGKYDGGKVAHIPVRLLMLKQLRNYS